MTIDLLNALAGGVLIGAAAGLLLLLTGRMGGVTGIVAGAMTLQRDAVWRAAFLGGLLTGGLLAPAIAPDAVIGFDESWGLLVVAGLLVGWGARFGGGCTSGHGVCGIGRLSWRSVVGCTIFMVVAMGVVFVRRHVL